MALKWCLHAQLWLEVGGGRSRRSLLSRQFRRVPAQINLTPNPEPHVAGEGCGTDATYSTRDCPCCACAPGGHLRVSAKKGPFDLGYTTGSGSP